jgi:hypothetical protein
LSIVPRRDPASRIEPASPRLDTYAATPRNAGSGTADISPSRVAAPRSSTFGALRRDAGSTSSDASPSRTATSRYENGARPGASSPNAGQRTAASRVPHGDLARDSGSVSRPRGSNSVGTRYAVPRNSYVTSNHYYPERAHHYHSVYVAPVHYLYHTHFYYYPQYLYPYGYGAFGLGYFYYDPYAWAPVATMGYDGNA